MSESIDELRERLESCRAVIRDVQEARVWPGEDLFSDKQVAQALMGAGPNAKALLERRAARGEGE